MSAERVLGHQLVGDLQRQRWLHAPLGLEGYFVDANGRATPTTGFGALCLP